MDESSVCAVFHVHVFHVSLVSDLLLELEKVLCCKLGHCCPLWVARSDLRSCPTFLLESLALSPLGWPLST